MQNHTVFKVALLLMMITGLYFTCAAQQEKILEGNIQTYPIIIKLSIFGDSECLARYFYTKERKDIELEGKVSKNGSIVITTNGWESVDSNNLSEKFELTPKGSSYTGTWMNRKKSLPVELAATTTDKFKHPYSHLAYVQSLLKEDPYSYIRTAGLEFVKDSTTQTGASTLDWYHEINSGINLFRISSGYDPAALKKINEQLLEAHIKESNASLECASPYGRGEYDEDIQHIFAHTDLFSVNIFASYNCGGAHPDFGSLSLNFDTHSGELLQLEDVFWFNKQQPPKKDTDEWNVYHESVMAKRIVELLSRLYPEKMHKPYNANEGCDYSNLKTWSFPNWYFTPKGVYIGAIFPRSLRPCDEPDWSVIPYYLMKQYLKPDSKIKLPQ